jgi:hypothetical protein
MQYGLSRPSPHMQLPAAPDAEPQMAMGQRLALRAQTVDEQLTPRKKMGLDDGLVRNMPQHSQQLLGGLFCAFLFAAPGLAADGTSATTQLVRIDLPALNATERAWVADPRSIPGPLRIGFGRRVPIDDVADALASGHHWQQSPDGHHVAVVQLHSPGALGLRIALSVAALPDAALLAFFDAKGMPAGLFSGVELNAADGPFWSPLIRGDRAALAVSLPPGTESASVHISLPRVSHLLRWPVDDSDMRAAAADPCRLKVACHPDWEPASRATALLVYTDATGGTGTCTGTLLRDTDPATNVPHVITARHCVPDQHRAAGIEAVWFHRIARCGNTVDLPAQAVSGGAELLFADALSDISLLRLRHPPPTGAVFADWSVRLPDPGTALASVHHPLGLQQAITFGSVTALVPCAEVPLCEGDGSDAVGHYLRVSWLRGGTDIGSSGAGLFLPSGALVGVLSGGFGDCLSKPGPDHYGRFDLAYRAGLFRWLGAP